MNHNAKKFNYLVMAFTFLLLGCMAIIIIIIDPFFHYHAPIDGLAYAWGEERYQNNGIVRHFEYDAIITGTSMSQNFKTSEMDKLFGTNAIKVTYSGGEYNEIDANLIVALESNRNIKMVLRGVDFNSLLHDKDTPLHDIADKGYQYPWYMIDSNYLTDVSYIFNKSIFLQSIDTGLAKGELPSFDTYHYWGDSRKYGKKVVFESRKAGYYNEDKPISDVQRRLNDNETELMLGNIDQNIIQTIESYPDVEFYLFIPPYSICFWDSYGRGGNINVAIDAMCLLTKKLVQYDNVKLFAFWNNYEMITNLDNYRDIYHYGPNVNSKILHWMAEEDEKYLLTKDNYQEYWNEIRNFYSNYDYDSIFEEEVDEN